MLFRDINGNLIELNRYDFKNDKIYYQEIRSIYTGWINQKLLAKL